VIANLTTERIDVGQLVALVYDDVDVSLHQMAELSLNAHLIKLALDGRVLESEQGWYLPAQ
jgi:hypothetical protein